MTFQPQDHGERFSGRRIVVHDKNPTSQGPLILARIDALRSAALATNPTQDGEDYHELAALPQPFTMGLDDAAMHFNETRAPALVRSPSRLGKRFSCDGPPA